MRMLKLAVALLLVPALAAAQHQSTARIESRTEADVKARAAVPPVHAGLSAEARAKLEAMFESARDRHLPTEPMEDRVAEGRAKGAAEAQILAAVARTKAQLEVAQTAMVRAGREHPSHEEVSRGASLIARGATRAQLEAFVRQAPADRSLVVAFEVLSELSASGVPVDQALAVVAGRLEAKATDAQLASLTGSVGLHGGAQAGAQAGATAGTQAGAGVGLGAGVGTKGLGETTGSVTGTVTGTLGIGLGRRP